MFDPTTTAIITGATGNIVAYMLNGRVDALRSWVARVFRRGTEEQRSQSLHALEEDIAALAQKMTSEAEVRARWGVLLASYLAAHPDARADINDIAATSTQAKTINIGSQHNHGSGTFIGGDNFGSISSPTSRDS